MKNQFMRLFSLVTAILLTVSLVSPTVQAYEDSEDPRYLTVDEVLTLTQHHIDGYMATDCQTMGRDIIASDQFIDLSDMNDELYAYIVPLMEDDANIGYITMPAKNSGSTFYEIYIKDGIVDNMRDCTAYMVSEPNEVNNSRIYFLPPYSYVLAVDIDGDTTYYDFSKHNIGELELRDISDKFSLSMAQSTYAEREETVNEKIENILQPNMRAMAVRVEDVRLSYEAEGDFIPIYFNGETYYGGNQDWYFTYWAQETGCGPTAASNITYYLDRQSSMQISGLYDYSTLTHDNFVDHMNTLYDYCLPSPVGNASLSEWTDAVVRYAGDRGVNLYPVYSSLPFTFENTCTYIKNGLVIDSPVAILDLAKGTPYGWHWMTITKYFRDSADVRYIAVSSFGERVAINYGDLYDDMTNSIIGSITNSGLMYFM